MTADEFPPEVVEAVARALLESVRARLEPRAAVPTWEEAAKFQRANGAMQADLLCDARAALAALPPAARAVLTGQAVAVPRGGDDNMILAARNAHMAEWRSASKMPAAIRAAIAASPWAPRDE